MVLESKKLFRCKMYFIYMFLQIYSFTKKTLYIVNLFFPLETQNTKEGFVYVLLENRFQSFILNIFLQKYKKSPPQAHVKSGHTEYKLTHNA